MFFHFSETSIICIYNYIQDRFVLVSVDYSLFLTLLLGLTTSSGSI